MLIFGYFDLDNIWFSFILFLDIFGCFGLFEYYLVRLYYFGVFDQFLEYFGF